MEKVDSALADAFIASPNHDARTSDRVDLIVLHYTGMSSGMAAQDRLCDIASKVSSHYLVYEDGRIVQLVQENRRARHAGVSFWRGWTDINSRSIGIEIVNGGHDFGLPPFPAEQIEAVCNLCHDIRSRWPVHAAGVVAHSDVTPARKQDPGENFPWDVLSARGIGLLVTPAPVADGTDIKIGDEGEMVSRLQWQLSSYGYGLSANGIFDRPTEQAVTAFQRHFRPGKIDGVADVSTRRTLKDLLDARAGLPD